MMLFTSFFLLFINDFVSLLFSNARAYTYYILFLFSHAPQACQMRLKKMENYPVQQDFWWQYCF